jgi:hypothetical protein
VRTIWPCGGVAEATSAEGIGDRDFTSSWRWSWVARMAKCPSDFGYSNSTPIDEFRIWVDGLEEVDRVDETVEV